MKRLIAALCCAAALAVFVAPGARADEYTKQTFLTFSGPVQVPGATLPAGTYMFKLADPDSGRRAIQIWDQEGGKLITTLLTIPNDRMEAADEPVVLFTETPAGNPQAVRAWFYPGDLTGMEFIYPKDQAMRIARDSRTSVLSYNDDVSANDTVIMRGAQVGRMDATGQVAELDAEGSRASTNTSSASTADNTATASTAPTQAATDNQANRSGAPAPTAAADSSAPDSTTASTAPTAAAAPAPSDNQANRSGAPAQTATASNTAAPPTTTAPTATAQARETAAPAPVGTSGQVASNEPRQELPRTASPLTVIQLLAASSLLGSLGVRRLRRRYATNRT